MKKLIAVMQGKSASREEMAKKLEEILIPLAQVVNNESPIYYGFPVESIAIKGSENKFIVSFEDTPLALIDLKTSEFSVFGSPKYDLTAEEHAVISHLWSKLKEKKSDNNIHALLKLMELFKGDN